MSTAVVQQPSQSQPSQSQPPQKAQPQQPSQRGGGNGRGRGRGRGRGGGGGGNNNNHNNNNNNNNGNNYRGRGGGGRQRGRGRMPRSPDLLSSYHHHVDDVEAEFMMDEMERAAQIDAMAEYAANRSNITYTTQHNNAPSTNLNHLLNFRYERSTPQDDSHHRRRRHKGPTFNKETYMQASCHFVISPPADQSCLHDPDHLVPWHIVEQVYVPVESVRLCPICLEKPVAARITKCAHVFCAPCILHYLSLSSRSWSRCPLCFESVYPQALKSAVFWIQPRPPIGSHMDMILVHRYKDEMSCHIMDDDVESERFTRVTVIDDITPILQRELKELQECTHMSDPEEQKWVRVATDEINTRHQTWLLNHPLASQKPLGKIKLNKSTSSTSTPRDNPVTSSSSSTSTSTSTYPMTTTSTSRPPSIFVNDAFFDDPEEAAAHRASLSRSTSSSASSTSTSTSTSTTSTSTSTPTIPPSMKSTPSLPEREAYHFYQSRDGRQCYMHSISFRGLLYHYGDVSHLPPTIRVRVDEMDGHTMDGQTRKKFRFLSHLPTTSLFSIVLIDLTPHIDATALERVRPDLESDRRSRAKRLREQMKLNERLKRAAGYHEDEPIYGSDRWIPPYQPVNFSHPDAAASFPTLSDAATVSREPTTTKAGYSTITRAGYASSELWEALPSSPSLSHTSSSPIPASRSPPITRPASISSASTSTASPATSDSKSSAPPSLSLPPPDTTATTTTTTVQSAWGRAVTVPIRTTPVATPVEATPPPQIQTVKKGKKKVLLFL